MFIPALTVNPKDVIELATDKKFNVDCKSATLLISSRVGLFGKVIFVDVYARIPEATIKPLAISMCFPAFLNFWFTYGSFKSTFCSGWLLLSFTEELLFVVSLDFSSPL